MLNVKDFNTESAAHNISGSLQINEEKGKRKKFIFERKFV